MVILTARFLRPSSRAQVLRTCSNRIEAHALSEHCFQHHQTSTNQASLDAMTLTTRRQYYAEAWMQTCDGVCKAKRAGTTERVFLFFSLFSDRPEFPSLWRVSECTLNPLCCGVRSVRLVERPAAAQTHVQATGGRNETRLRRNRIASRPRSPFVAHT